VLFIILAALPGAARAEGVELRVMEDAVLWPVERSSRARVEDWWLISPRGENAGATRVTLRFHPPHCDKRDVEPCDDEAWSQRIEARAAEDAGKAFGVPFYLLRGDLDWPGARRADPASGFGGDFDAGFDLAAPRSEITVTLGGRDYMIARTLARDKSRLTVSLRSGDIEQELYACPAGGPTYPYCGDEGFEEILWAGDLDGDGRLDLLAQFTEKYSKRAYFLYTSGGADPGGLVAPAAEYSRFVD
jgi:hypothetical protein